MKNPKRERVIEIITDAFSDNKSVNFVVKQDKRRIDRIKSLVSYSYALCEKTGEVMLNKEQTVAAMISLPHKGVNPFFSLIENVKLIFHSIGISRVPLILKRESLIKRHHPSTPFCYLWYIGVAEDQRKNSLGSFLLQEIIGKYDQLDLPIYLETSTAENVPWYEKNGFQVYKKLDDFGFIIYMMRRSNKKRE